MSEDLVLFVLMGLIGDVSLQYIDVSIVSMVMFLDFHSHNMSENQGSVMNDVLLTMIIDSD